MIDSGLVLNQRFKILERLGAGGMGEVYLGLDQSNGQMVAVKRLLIEQENADKELLDRRFTEEIQILRRLDCPGIPAFVDAFIEDGHSFLVMEFIKGYSLDTMLRVSRLHNARLTAEQVATVALHVSRVLEYMHSMVPPLVHRDIKPSNMIIRESDERVFLVDFGLAREIRSKSSAKTQIGTWCYAPVEQIRGQVEPRSDFYSLGVTMLELLSGEVPAALAIPPARQLIPDLPEELARIIDRCTKAEVTQRYSEACLLRQDLELVLPRLAGSAQATGPTPPTAEEQVSELVRRWGRGRAVAQEPPATPPPAELQPVVPVGATPEVRKAVDRARRRLQDDLPVYRRRRILFTVFLACLVLTGLWLGWSQYHSRAQLSLAASAFPGGGPGPGWSCIEARGLFPSDGLGLGQQILSPFAHGSGVFFQRNQPLAARQLSFRFKALQGKPEVLVFLGALGVRLQPLREGYQADIVRLGPLPRLQSPTYEKLGLRASLPETCQLSLTITARHLVLSRDGREQGRLSRPPDLDWSSTTCGILQMGSGQGQRSLVSGLTVR